MPLLTPSPGFDIDSVIALHTEHTSDPVGTYDEKFYFQDVFIQVESTIFKLHRRNFECGSEVFRDMFSVPQGENMEGRTKQNPIVLSGVRCIDFVQLLRILFPTEYGARESLNSGQWISVLRLADLWNFAEIRKHAIEQLDSLLGDASALKVALATKYNIYQWILPALVALARREEPLGMEDYKLLGRDNILLLSRVREEYVPKCEGCPQFRFTFETPSGNIVVAPPTEPALAAHPGGAGQGLACKREDFDFTSPLKKVFSELLLDVCQSEKQSVA